MDERLVAADAALKAGRSAEAIQLVMGLLQADPAQTAQIYRVLLVQLYRAERHAEGEHWSALASQRFPRDPEIWNIRGVFLRKLKRYHEAVQALDQALKIRPTDVGTLGNKGNVLLDMGENTRAEMVFAKLARQEPRNSEHQRQLGRALMRQKKRDAGMVRLRQAVALKKDNIDAWLDLTASAVEVGNYSEAEGLIDKGLEHSPDHPKLLEAKSMVMRQAGEPRRAAAWLTEIAPRFETAGWLQFQLGGILSEYDRDQGNVHLRKAVELEPTKLDYLTALIESLERTRSGDEGANIDEAYGLTERALQLGSRSEGNTKTLNDILCRVLAFDEAAPLGDFATLGRGWAEGNKHTALMRQLPRVRSMEDRVELLEHHRIWGRKAEAAAASHPIRRPAPRPPGDKIRIGFMSSDLKNHPVAYFALPLFEHYDRDRFEVYAYSYYQGSEDPTQAHIRELCTAFRWNPDINDRDAAQLIADDDLDMLIELGGSTHMNKLSVMAYKPAPLSASWVGYPFSAGLETIDYLVVDPYMTPEDPSLMVEKPLVLPHTWYALGSRAFRADPAVDPRPPFERNGFITFGTANNSYKYTPELFDAWAAVLNAVPDSQFLFVRPEGGSRTFRTNALALFARSGVAPERIRFEPVRGRHLPHYNSMDISLDAFPQTGGTTTCESMWMGVPVVTLVGPAVFERLSYSVLMNLDLPELCARTPAEYVAAATALANDRPRLAELRRTLRPRMQASHLGRTEEFARDYFDAVERVVRQDRAGAAKPRAVSAG
jgi:predicted O-linked N-acetylglucosamine transferase (SPINDLY family)